MIFSERKQKIAKQMLKLEHKLLMYVLIAIKKKICLQSEVLSIFSVFWIFTPQYDEVKQLICLRYE